MRSPIEIVADWIEGGLSPTAMVDLIERYGAACAAEQREQLKHTKAKINEQANYIEQLEKARDFWHQKYKDATGASAPTPTPR